MAFSIIPIWSESSSPQCDHCLALSLYQPLHGFQPTRPISPNPKSVTTSWSHYPISSLGGRGPLLSHILVSQQGQMFITSPFPPSNIISISNGAELVEYRAAYCLLWHWHCFIQWKVNGMNVFSGHLLADYGSEQYAKCEMMADCEMMSLISSWWTWLLSPVHWRSGAVLGSRLV